MHKFTNSASDPWGLCPWTPLGDFATAVPRPHGPLMWILNTQLCYSNYIGIKCTMLVQSCVQPYYNVTGWAVAQTCCISQCANYRKSGIFGYRWEQNPWTDRHETWGTYLRPGPYLNFQIWERSACVGRLGACAKYHCLWLSFFSFFSFLHHATVHDLYIKRRVFAQGSAFWGSRWRIFTFTPFSPKIWKFALRPMATSSGNNSAIFKDRSKMFAPKWGFWGSGNLTASSKFACDRPLLPW